MIDGSPLNIWISPRGELQVRYDGETAGQFFDPDLDIQDAGFNLATDVGRSTERVHGFSDGSNGPGSRELALRSQSPVSGNGTAASPFHQITSYEAFCGAQSR